MFTEPAPIEHVYQLSDESQVKMLRQQFDLFYRKIVEQKIVPQAAFEKIDGLERYFTGMPKHNFNAVFGCPAKGVDFDQCINQHKDYFDKKNMPFIWYVNEEDLPEFKEKLKQHGFVDLGVFRGVMGPLDQQISQSPIPDDCVLEMVKDEDAMEEFNNLVCTVFGIDGPSKEAYKLISWNIAKEKDPMLFHWIARKNGKVVSAVSTMIENGVVSFWNGASLPEVRKQGINTALRRFALQHGIAKGGRFGSSYLMSEGLAFGICSKLGYKTKWRFHAFLSPASSGNPHGETR